MSCSTIVVSTATVADIPQLEADIECFKLELAKYIAERDAVNKKISSTRGSIRYREEKLAKLKAQQPTPTPTPTPTINNWAFRPSGANAGGWVTHLDSARDGTLVASNDTVNMHIRGVGDSEWTPFIRPGINIPENEYIRTDDVGNWDIGICASNSDYIYAFIGGYCWKTADRGKTITRTNFAFNKKLSHGGDARVCGRRVKVDPSNHDCCLVMALDGLDYTLDGGNSWKRHTDIPAWTVLSACIAFDETGLFVGNLTQHLFVHVPGVGVYESKTGVVGKFSLIPGSPVTCSSMHFGGGKLHCIGRSEDGNNGQYSNWDGTSWFAPAGISGHSLAIRPSNPSHIFICVDSGGPVRFSNDGGKTFVPLGSRNRVASDIPWLAWTKEDWMSNGDMIFHKSLDRLIISEGIGVWYVDTPPMISDAGFDINSISLGINMMCTMGQLVDPNGRYHVSCMDRPVFSFGRDDASKPAAFHGTHRDISIIHAGPGMDYACDDPDYVVAAHLGGRNLSVSYDGGRTPNWQGFPSIPKVSMETGQAPFSIFGGGVAIGNKGNILWAPCNNLPPFYTKDGGNTWEEIKLGGYRVALNNAYYLNRNCIASDKQNPGTFYLYCRGNPNDPAYDTATKGLWKTSDGGVKWIRIYSNLITSFGQDFWNGDLRLVPTKSPNMFWSVGSESGIWDSPSGEPLHFSPDGTSWFSLPGLGEVSDVAFGMARPGSTYPAIYAIGWKDGKFGVWVMFDFNPSTITGTWELISHFPGGSPDYINSIAADMGKFGRIYLGLAGSSQLVGDLVF